MTLREGVAVWTLTKSVPVYSFLTVANGARSKAGCWIWNLATELEENELK